MKILAFFKRLRSNKTQPMGSLCPVKRPGFFPPKQALEKIYIPISIDVLTSTGPHEEEKSQKRKSQLSQIVERQHMESAVTALESSKLT